MRRSLSKFITLLKIPDFAYQSFKSYCTISIPIDLSIKKCT